MKTTKKDFELFKVECERWVEIFGLQGWHVRYDHCKIDKDGVKADCLYSITARDCEIRLTTHYPINVTKKSIERDAFHEVCELLLGGLVTCAEYRYITKPEIEEHTHAIIRILENVLWSENDK